MISIFALHGWSVFFAMHSSIALLKPTFTILLVGDFHDIEFLQVIVVLHYANSTDTLERMSEGETFIGRFGIPHTLNTSTSTKISGFARSTLWPSGTHFAISSRIAALLNVV